MSRNSVSVSELAGIQYHGLAGVTEACLQAIARLIQFGDRVEKAYLLSNADNNSRCGTHCYLLFLEYDVCVAVKSGFSSGYGGEGPTGLSTSLQMLIRHNTEIDEYDVSSDIISRIDKSCLLSSDLDLLRSARPVRPTRFYDYIRLTNDRYPYDNRQIQQAFPDVIPFSIVDERIMDLAISFADNPDLALMTAFRRLEDIVRKRSQLEDASGAKLFSQVFQANDRKLYWPDVLPPETQGRVNLFTGTYMAYRNSRAHKEVATPPSDGVREFLLINQLFVLESEATEVSGGDEN